MRDEFSVYQFFPDDSYECVRQWVSIEDATNAAIHYCSSVGARMGTTMRVIITDGGDAIVFEWTHADGITFPEQLKKPPKPPPPATAPDILPNPFKGPFS